MWIANRRTLNMYVPSPLRELAALPWLDLREANRQACGRYVLLQEGLVGLAVPHKRSISPDGSLLGAQRNAV